MSASTYKRATKKYPARVDHTDGDVSEGFVLVPIGSDFATALSKAIGFLTFEMDSGEITYLNMQAIKRVTAQEEAADTGEADRTRREAEREARAKADASERGADAGDGAQKKQKPVSPYTRKEEFDALDLLGLDEKATHEELHAAYRRLVKLYHPDRLRGLGVSGDKIAYAAERLVEINSAYRLLSKVSRAA